MADSRPSSTSSSLICRCAASSATVGARPSRWARSPMALVSESLSSCRRRGTRTAQPLSRKCRLISPTMVGRGVGGELHAALQVEPVDRLDQPDRGDLGEVVEPLAAVAEPAGEVLHQRQVQLDQLAADTRRRSGRRAAARPAARTARGPAPGRARSARSARSPRWPGRPRSPRSPGPRTRCSPGPRPVMPSGARGAGVHVLPPLAEHDRHLVVGPSRESTVPAIPDIFYICGRITFNSNKIGKQIFFYSSYFISISKHIRIDGSR